MISCVECDWDDERRMLNDVKRKDEGKERNLQNSYQLQVHGYPKLSGNVG